MERKEDGDEEEDGRKQRVDVCKKQGAPSLVQEGGVDKNEHNYMNMMLVALLVILDDRTHL